MKPCFGVALAHPIRPVSLVFIEVDGDPLSGLPMLPAWWDQHRGTRVERTRGEMALFDDPADAVGFARAYQHALRQLTPPRTARVAVHHGPVAVRPNPPDHVARGASAVEVDGLTVAVAARIASIAQPGQILASEQALHVTRDLSTRAQGHWHLKGAPAPVAVFEIRQDSQTTPPPVDRPKAYRVRREGSTWAPAAPIPHRWPAEWDRYVGRSEAADALEALIESGARLITVVGMPGVGKTRFVTHFGRDHLMDFPGGSWFCDLSEARDGDDLLRTVAASLGAPLEPAPSVPDLARRIAARGRCLVALDNFEPLIAVAPTTVQRWLSMCADATFLMTSREVLGLPGETTFTLAPMPVDEATALFLQRAPIPVEDDALATVAELVRQLDGLPLAIELAAGRMPVFTPASLLERMSDRFRVLTSRQGRVGRHASLRAALDWSWERLTDDEQAALVQLSVFETAFGLDEAESVLQLADAWPMDAVQSLVDKSLVVHREDGRFDLPFSVRAYASGRRHPG